MNIVKLEATLRKKGYDDHYIDLCREYSLRLVENNLPVIFDKKHLSSLIGVKIKYLNSLIVLTDNLYKQVEIPKKSGGKRKISIPFEGLKYVQRWILDNILYKIRTSGSSMGFTPELSIVSNAEVHVEKDCIINLDIKNFFPSIKFERVFNVFYYHGYTKEIAYLLARLCTYKGKLPQGAPTSPYLSNIICLKLDKRLNMLSEKLKANYTRYADDITISGYKYISKYINIFKKIINEEGFKVNWSKKRINHSDERQMVTGLIVNKKVSVPRNKKKYLRQQIYYCKKYGVNEHLSYIENNKSNFKEHLYGLALFIKMVEKNEGEKFLQELKEIKWSY